MLPCQSSFEVVSDRNDGTGLKNGDKLPVLLHQGNGVYSACFKDKVISFAPFYNDERKEYTPSSRSNIKLNIEPKAEGWARVNLEGGTTGFAELVGNFENLPDV